MPEYRLPGADGEGWSTPVAGVAGTLVVFALAAAAGWSLRRRKTARAGEAACVEARVALLAVLACVVVTVLTPAGHWARLGAEGALVAAALVALRAPPRWLLGRLTLLLPFVLLSVASVPFVQAGAAGVPVSVRVVSFLARTLISLGALAALFQAIRAPELLLALARLRVPPIFVTLMSLMLRYLGLLEDEARRMLRARSARGIPPTLGRRAAVTGGMVGSLFLRSFERAERVSQAMQARGFTGLLPAPTPRPLLISELLLLAGAVAVQGVIWRL
jgi:cobalt/nickel transport system permease protein